MKTLFTYRIRPTGSKAILMSGSGRIAGDSFSAIVRDVMQRAGVLVHVERFGADSAMAGCVFRTEFHLNGQPVVIAITPMAESFVAPQSGKDSQNEN